MKDDTIATAVVPFLLAIGLFIALMVGISSEADDCHKKKCTTGEPVFFSREMKCLCSEVPK